MDPTASLVHRSSGRPVRDGAVLLAGSALQDVAFAAAQLALPLVVLAETGSVAFTGLIAGASGLPVLTSPWWAVRARQWVRTGRRLAALGLFEGATMCLVPTAAAVGVLNAVVLVAAGILLGASDTLSRPGRAALLADVGDRWRPGGAARMLVWKDLIHRIGMVVGPALAALGVAAGLTSALLWTQAFAMTVSGVLACPVRAAERTTRETESTELRIRDALNARPEVFAGWLARGTGCLSWFAFALGLSVLGSEQERPGALIGWGMTSYGLGAILGTLVASQLIPRWSVLHTVRVSWSTAGLAWIAVAAWPDPLGAAVGGAIGGASVALGATTVNAAITRSSVGVTRRTLLSGQEFVVSASHSAGMLLGGVVLSAIGARWALVTTGMLVMAVAVLATSCAGRRRPKAHRQ